MKSVQRAAKTFYGFQLLQGLGFGVTATVYALFLRSIGASYQELSIVNMVFWATIVLAELPTGMLADGKNRGWSVKIGAIVTALGVGSYMLAQNVGMAILSEIALGIGYAFISGALQAWLADSLKNAGAFEKLRTTFATGAVVRALAILFGGLFGGYIADAFGLRASMALSFVGMAGAAILALAYIKNTGEPETRVTEWEALRRSWAIVGTHPALKWSMLASIGIGVVALWNMYWTVFFEPRVGGQIGLGWTWVALYGAVTVAGLCVRRMRVAAGKEEIGMLFSLIATAAGFLLAGMFLPLPLLLLALMIHEAGRGAFEPLLDSFTHHHVDSSHRATYASFQSLISRLGYVAALALGTVLTHNTTDSTSVVQLLWFVSGIFLFGVVAVLFVLRPKHVVT